MGQIREKTGKGKKGKKKGERKEREKSKKGYKKRDANLFSFSLLVGMGGLIGGGAIAPSCMMKGYLIFISYIPVFQSGSNRSP
jgi:hypothetical protein